MSPVELMQIIKKEEIPASSGVFDWSTSRVVHRNRVILVSDRISRNEALEFGFDYAESVQRALDKTFDATKDAKVTVLPVGGLTVPIIE